jgi:hypothetical protein
MSGTIDPRHTYDEYLVLLAKSGKTNEEDKVECDEAHSEEPHGCSSYCAYMGRG